MLKKLTCIGLGVMIVVSLSGCGKENKINEYDKEIVPSNSQAVSAVMLKERMTSKEVADIGIHATYFGKAGYCGEYSVNEPGWIIHGVVMNTEDEKSYMYYKDNGFYTGEYLCNKYLDNIEKIVLPSYIDDKPVVAIGTGSILDQAMGVSPGFEKCKRLKEIVVPNTVKEIGDLAFNSKTIEKIYISSSVNNIERINSLIVCDNLKEIIVDENNKFFSSENGILYNKDKTILYWYPNMHKELYVSEKVEKINFVDWIIEDVESNGYLSFGESIPWRGTNLEKIIVNENNKKYCDIDGVLFTKNKEKLLIYPSSKKNTSYEIPNGTKMVIPYAFSWSEELKDIYVPKTVQYMDTNYDHTLHYAGTEEEWKNVYHREEYKNIIYNPKAMDISISKTVKPIESLEIKSYNSSDVLGSDKFNTSLYSAKELKGIINKMNPSIKLDLNGDGIIDTINYVESDILEINNVNYAVAYPHETDFGPNTDIVFVDLNKNDKFIEIMSIINYHGEGCADDEGIVTRIYSYNGTDMKRLFGVYEYESEMYWNSDLGIVSDNLLIFDYLKLDKEYENNKNLISWYQIKNGECNRYFCKYLLNIEIFMCDSEGTGGDVVSCTSVKDEVEIEYLDRKFSITDIIGNKLKVRFEDGTEAFLYAYSMK